MIRIRMAGGVKLPDKMDPRLLKAAEEAIPSSPNVTIYEGISNRTMLVPRLPSTLQ